MQPYKQSDNNASRPSICMPQRSEDQWVSRILGMLSYFRLNSESVWNDNYPTFESTISNIVVVIETPRAAQAWLQCSWLQLVAWRKDATTKGCQANSWRSNSAG